MSVSWETKTTTNGRENKSMKKQTMYERYHRKQPTGTYSFCNTLGVAIFAPDELDKYKDGCELIAAWVADNAYYGFHSHMIFYSTAGRPFIRKGSLRIYLDEVILCDR